MRGMKDSSRAAGLMLFSALSFAVMGIFVKLIPEVATPVKVICRNFVTLAVALVLLLRSGRPLFGARENQKYLLARSLFGICGVSCYFYAINHLLLADAALLGKLSPFVVAMLAWWILSEVPNRWVVAALCIAFVGGLLVLKPRFDYSFVPALAGLGSAVFAGSAYAAVRFLKGRETPETIVFYFSLTTIVVLVPFGLAGCEMPNAEQFWIMLGIGLAAAGGQFGLTAAYHHAPAAEVSLYSYATVLFSAIFGFAFWSEVPDVWSLAGGVMIIGAGVLVLMVGRR